MTDLSADFNLTTLANKYGSDKGSAVGNAHNYTPFYEMFLGLRRHDVRRMLEIGLLLNGPEVGASADRQTGDLPSIRMWLEYFPNAVVHGFDISDFSFFEHPRFVFTRGDAGNRADLDRVGAPGEAFDLVIDDGSHASFHQQLSLLSLFPKLAPGGLYIVEDLDWQPSVYEQTLPYTMRTSELLAYWFRMHRFPEMPGALAPLGEVADQISMIQLYEHPFIPDRLVKAAVIQKKF